MASWALARIGLLYDYHQELSDITYVIFLKKGLIDLGFRRYALFIVGLLSFSRSHVSYIGVEKNLKSGRVIRMLDSKQPEYIVFLAIYPRYSIHHVKLKSSY